MIQVKNQKVLVSLLQARFHPKLRALIKWVVFIAGIYITEGHRPKKHKHDLHGTRPVRAIDGRSSIYTNPTLLANGINRNWIYDPGRPTMKCAVYHARCPSCGHDQKHEFSQYCDQCGRDITNHWHIHFQVHPKTVFVKDGKGGEEE